MVDRVGMGEGQEFLKKGVKTVGERQRGGRPSILPKGTMLIYLRKGQLLPADISHCLPMKGVTFLESRRCTQGRGRGGIVLHMPDRMWVLLK